ncbi:MAG: DUF4190 domain-containing protein [Planctomycetota bacterium]
MSDPATSSSTDGIAGLKAMSTTAGLTAPGADSYRAVNPFAVAAIVTGVLTVGGLLHPVFLALPVLGVLLAIVAVVQIQRSRGTQAGVGLACIGLALSVGLGGFLIYRQQQAQQLERQYVTEVQTYANVFGDAVTAGDMTQAYAMTSEGFRQAVPFPQFERFFTGIRGSADGPFGLLTSVETNDRVAIVRSAGAGQAEARGVLTFTLMKDGEEQVVKQVANLSRRPGGGANGGDIWQVTSFSEWFQ